MWFFPQWFTLRMDVDRYAYDDGIQLRSDIPERVQLFQSYTNDNSRPSKQIPISLGRCQYFRTILDVWQKLLYFMWEPSNWPSSDTHFFSEKSHYLSLYFSHFTFQKSQRNVNCLLETKKRIAFVHSPNKVHTWMKLKCPQKIAVAYQPTSS